MSDTAAVRPARRLAGARFAVAIACGAVAGLGQAPFGMIPVAIAAFAVALGLLHRAGTVRRAAWVGFAIGTGYFATTLHWIVEPFLVDVQRHGWMAPFGLFFSATGFALFWTAAFAAARALARGGWRLSAAWAVALTLAEVARAKVLTGFPWAMPGYVWSDSAALPLAGWIGPFGVTLMTLVLAAIVYAAVNRAPSPAVAAGAGAVALAVAWTAPVGLSRLVAPVPPQPAADAPLIRLVQPNAPQDEKWDPERAPVFFRRQLDFTAQPGNPDLVIWPETAIPYLAEAGHPAFERIAEAAGDRPVILGAQRTDGRRYFNSAFVLGPSGRITARYDKHHLVPFGEYVPLGSLGSWIGVPSFAADDGFGFSPGPGPQVLDLGGGLGDVLPLICYEAIFPRDVAGAPRRADWMLQLTNDAWFGTFAGPQQHLAQARFRAAEQGLPMLRVANTGISAVIDATGAVSDQIPLGEAGYRDVRLPQPLPPTPYARSGDWPLIALLLLAAGGLALVRRRA
ncbi:apolipoprotein N-acyltransferase [Tranquillimonas rosea]|uniref:apolipoprotein N-acyltransferase n=1 Tax=Tranquillimonas rosea TaxID=641238 RepID=UPI003BAD94CB